MNDQRTRPTHPSFFIIAYPWDLPLSERDRQSPSLDPLLDRLRGEIGLTGLSVWAGSRPVQTFRAHDVRPRLIHADGGVMVPPPALRGGCRPVPCSIDCPPGRLSAIADGCAARDMELRWMMAAQTIGQLALRYPEFASRSAFGEESRICVCLLNACVQECLLELIRAASSRWGAARFVLADFSVGWLEAFSKEIEFPASLEPAHREILSTCFCRSCTRLAQEHGIDDAAVQGTVREIIQAAISGSESRPGDVLREWAAYRDLQLRHLEQFLSTILSACEADIYLIHDSRPGPLCVSDYGGVCGAIAPIDDWTRLDASAPAARQSEVLLPAGFLHGPRGEEFIANVSTLGGRGITGVHVDHYGILPDASWTALRQAIRFARRSVDFP